MTTRPAAFALPPPLSALSAFSALAALFPASGWPPAVLVVLGGGTGVEGLLLLLLLLLLFPFDRPPATVERAGRVRVVATVLLLRKFFDFSAISHSSSNSASGMKSLRVVVVVFLVASVAPRKERGGLKD